MFPFDSGRLFVWKVRGFLGPHPSLPGLTPSALLTQHSPEDPEGWPGISKENLKKKPTKELAFIFLIVQVMYFLL